MTTTGAPVSEPADRPLDDRAEAGPAHPGRSPAGAARIRHVPALDGLRGAAVAGVLLYHGGYLTGGYLGVDLFFVLSGYLITAILLTEHRRTGRISLGAFWGRRARRLLPALIAVLLAVSAYALILANARDLGGIRADGLSTLFYVANWHTILAGTSYWASTGAPSPLQHTWSLAIEEQFYVVWPLVLIVLLRRGTTRTVLRVALGLAAASAGLMVVLSLAGTDENTLYLGTHTRAAAILLGAALATWQSRRRPTHDPTRKAALDAASLAALTLLAATWATVDIRSHLLYRGGLIACGVAVTVILAACTHPDRLLLGRAFAWGPLRRLGLISYGIYLWSWPLFRVLTPERTGIDGLPLFGVQVAATLVVSALSYVLIEQPVRRGSLAPATVRAFAPGAAALAVIALLGATLGAEGAPGRPGGSVPTAGYQRSSVPGAPKLLVVGDSVPELIADQGIAPLRDELGVSVLDRAVPGCELLRAVGPVKGLEGNIRQEVTPCANGWKDGVVDQYAPDVVMVMFGQFPNDEVELDGHFTLPCTGDYQQQEEAQLRAAVRELGAGGAKVVLVTSPGSTISWVVDAAPPGMAARVRCVNDLYKKVAAEEPNVGLVDFAPFICPATGDCRTSIDGVNLRPDTVHFEKDSARLVARWIVPRVLAEARRAG